MIEELYNNQDADVYILERSIWTDKYIFLELLKDSIGELRMTMYNKWWTMWSYIMPMRVDKWVLLDTSLEESLRRINSRNRDGKSTIDKEYQTNLYVKHIEFYDTLQKENKPVVIIDSTIMDTNLIVDNTKVENIIEQILN